MTAPIWNCWQIIKAVRQAATATRPFRRYRRARRVGKVAGIAAVKTTAHAARKAVIWKCIVVGGIGGLGTAAVIPPLFFAPGAVPSTRITQPLGLNEFPGGSGSGSIGSGSIGQLAFQPMGMDGNTSDEFFVLPGGRETDFAVPSGTLEFAPVPDCCSPAPQPNPETPPGQPPGTPVPEPMSFALLATAVALLRALV